MLLIGLWSRVRKPSALFQRFPGGFWIIDTILLKNVDGELRLKIRLVPTPENLFPINIFEKGFSLTSKAPRAPNRF